MSGRSMRQRQRISYAEDVHQTRQHQPSPVPLKTAQSSHQQYYNGRLIEKQFSHPAHNRLVFNANPGMNAHNFNMQNANNPTATGLTPKPPKQPTKPIAPSVRYSHRIWDRIKAERPNAKLWEISKHTNQMWRELSAEETQPYINEYEADKIEYNEKMQAYHNSPAYQAYTQYLARSKAQSETEAANDGRFRGQDLDELYAIQAARDPQRTQKPVSGALEGFDDELDMKLLCSKRYQRNHQLMSEIFDLRYVGAGWGADEASVAAQVYHEFDKQHVSTNYQGAGLIGGVPTLTQIKRLKSKVEQLQNVVKAERDKITEEADSFATKMIKYREKSHELDNKWVEICNEPPEETFRKWKEDHDSKLKEQLSLRQKSQKTKEPVKEPKPASTPAEPAQKPTPPPNVPENMETDAQPRQPQQPQEAGPTLHQPPNPVP